MLPQLKLSLLLHDLVSSLDLFILSKLRSGGLDNTNSNGLPHVMDSEPTQRWEIGESLNTHGLAGVQDDDSGITRLDELGIIFGRFTGTTINLLLDLSKLRRINYREHKRSLDYTLQAIWAVWQSKTGLYPLGVALGRDS